jgi:hypothetical protein
MKIIWVSTKILTLTVANKQIGFTDTIKEMENEVYLSFFISSYWEREKQTNYKNVCLNKIGSG